MLEIDIKALAACVDRLCWIYMKSGRQAELSIVLERLRGNIEDARWQRKISYFHTLGALGPHWDRDAGRKEFQKLGAIGSDENDLEILQLYIDLCGDDLPFSTLINLFDRILTLSDAVSDHLQYQGGKALRYLLIGDTEEAERELVGAIEYCRAAKPTEDLTSYERLWLSNCLDLLATLRRDADLFDEAIGILTNLLEEDGWTDEGRVMLFSHIGDCHRRARAWSDAESAYKRALAVKAAPICEVFLSETLLYQDKTKEATALISRINVDDLDSNEFLDFVFVFSAIAIETANKDRLAEAKKLLENLATSVPYFNERRLELLVNVSTTTESGRSDSIVRSTRANLAGMMRSANKYLVLQPNIMGLGLNLNVMIDDIANRIHAEALLDDDEEIGSDC